MTDHLTCRLTGVKVSGPFVSADDADIDWSDNLCPVCSASGYQECTAIVDGEAVALGRWVHAARGVCELEAAP